MSCYICGTHRPGETPTCHERCVVELRRGHAMLLQDFSKLADVSLANTERLERLKSFIGDGYSLCVQCGPNVMVDVDGLCATCGATCTGSYLDELREACL